MTTITDFTAGEDRLNLIFAESGYALPLIESNPDGVLNEDDDGVTLVRTKGGSELHLDLYVLFPIDMHDRVEVVLWGTESLQIGTDVPVYW